MPVKEYKLKVGFEGEPKNLISLTTYVFDRNGSLLVSVPFIDGMMKFSLDSEKVKEVRIFIAPTLTQKPSETVTFFTMKRLKAYEPVLGNVLNAGGAILPVPKGIYSCWGFNSCRITGRVVRPVRYGDILEYMPVQNAKVHICEVDKLPIIIRRIPYDILKKLARRVIDLIRYPFPPPPPPEENIEFEYDINIVDATPDRIAEMNSKVKALSANRLLAEVSEKVLEGSRSAVSLADKKVVRFVTELENAFQAGSHTKMAAVLDTNQAYWKRYLGDLKFLMPYYYDLDELAAVCSDENGRFDYEAHYYSGDDHPDIYFWVEYCIGGEWERVYKPCIGSTTIWDYPDGQKSQIIINDPRVPGNVGTASTPGKSVAVLRIGQNVSISEIQGSSAGGREGLTTSDEPFGASVEPVVSFGMGLNNSASKYYYKWSYRKLGSGAAWRAMDREVVRHYAEILPSGKQVFYAYQLGPKIIKGETNLFEINPVVPKSSIALTSFWAPIVDIRENSASSFFHTHLLEGGNAAAAAGKYELKLEIFEYDFTNDSVMKVNFTADNILLQVPASPAPFGTAAPVMRDIPVDTVHIYPSNIEDYLIRNAATRQVEAFRLVLMVDNTPCTASIDAPRLNGTPAQSCGFLEYTDVNDGVTLSFEASHQKGYATYSFTTFRGTTGQWDPASANASVNTPVHKVPGVNDPDVNGFLLNPITHKHVKNIKVSELIKSNHCNKAAFASSLYVWAKATDGYYRLDYLDRSYTVAFAVVPE